MSNGLVQIEGLFKDVFRLPTRARSLRCGWTPGEVDQRGGSLPTRTIRSISVLMP